MNISKLHDFCKEEKKKAMDLYGLNNKKKHDASVVANIWDELLAQLHKPGNVKKENFDKAKKLALRMTNLIADTKYKKKIVSKINNL